MRTLRLIALAASCGLPLCADAELVTGIKAVVHDSVITVQEVEFAAAPQVDRLRWQHRNQPDVFQKRVVEVLNDNLEQLLERQLILRDFESAGYNLPESIIDEVVQERLREQFGGDRTTLTKTLQAEGVTHEKFRQRLRSQFIIEALRAKNISAEVVMSPHKIERYYLDHQDKFQTEDRAKLRMISLGKPAGADAASTRALAEEILRKIKEGATFAEMAAVYSQDASRSRGGERGWEEVAALRQELRDAASALKPGEVSGVIETPEVFYLLLVEEKSPAHVKPLGDVRDEIERTLQIEERARLQKRYIDKLRAKTFVRYF